MSALPSEIEEKIANEALMQAKEEACSSGANVPQNHSTHCDGLMQVIAKLQKKLSKCTIVAGEISSGNTHCEKFELRFYQIL